MQTANIPLLNEKSIPDILQKNPEACCVIGLNTKRLVDIRKNRMNTFKENQNKDYVNLEKLVE